MIYDDDDDDDDDDNGDGDGDDDDAAAADDDDDDDDIKTSHKPIKPWPRANKQGVILALAPRNNLQSQSDSHHPGRSPGCCIP